MRRMIKTGVSGAGASMLDMGALVTLVEVFSVPVGLAAFGAAGVGAVAGYLVTKFWAFRDPNPVKPGQVAAYGLVSLGTASITAVLVHWLAGMMPYPAAKLVAAAVIFALWSYPAQRGLVFAGVHVPRGSHDEDEDDETCAADEQGEYVY